MAQAIVQNEPQAQANVGCCYKEQIPPALALIASIIAVFAALHFQNPYLAIPAVIGGAASIYAIQTAKTVSLLNSYKNELDALRNTRIELNTLIERQRNSIDEHKDKIQEINLCISSTQTQLNTTLANNDSHVRCLEHLKDNLGSMEEQITCLTELQNTIAPLEAMITNGSLHQDQLETALASFQETLRHITSFTNIIEQVNFQTTTDQLANKLATLTTQKTTLERARRINVILDRQLTSFGDVTEDAGAAR